MKIDEKFLNAYENANLEVENLIGRRPNDYKILMFIDPDLYKSVLLQTEATGSPKAVISSNELYVLQEMKNLDYVPVGKDLFFGSRSPRIFLPANISKIKSSKVLEAKIFQTLVKAVLVEETKSSFPDKLMELYTKDTVIYNLFTNNVYEFVLERGASWVWQYFQDFTATLRLLSLYNLDDFYVPPNSIRSASIFYNYLLETKKIIKERSKAVLNAPLYDLILNGFGEYALREYLKKYDSSVMAKIKPELKSNLGQPLGAIGNVFLGEQGENFEEIFENTLGLKNDQELTSIWNREKTKSKMIELREQLMNESLIWHASNDSYWSDLWPIRGSSFDKIDQYVGKIQRRGYKSFKGLQEENALVKSHGRVRLKDREVAVLSIQEDTVGQEQLVILRNHLEAKKDTFSTPLPGLPDTVVFRKFSGMHIASYLGVVDDKETKNYQKSPYDLPMIVRAVQVTSKKEAYGNQDFDEGNKIENVNYEDLKSLTEPQYRAIRYLIKQRDAK